MRERRRHPRYQVGSKVIAAVRKKHDSKVALFSTENVSEEGLLLMGEPVTSSLEQGHEVEITLHLVSDESDEKIYFGAVVVHLREDFRFGIQINSIDDINKKLLLTYIDHLAAEKRESN